MAITKPRSPPFQKTKSRPLERDYVNESAPKITQYKTASKSTAKLVTDTFVKQPSSTRAVELSQKRTRDEIEARKKLEEKMKKDDAMRTFKQNRVSNLGRF